MRRTDVIDAVLQALRVELQMLIRITQDALDEATGEQSRAENKYDTRGLEASYLAGAQSERILALKQVLAFYGVLDREQPAEGSAIRLGSLVQLAEGDDPQWWLIGPDGGGRRVEVGDGFVTVLSPGSPLGRTLLGARVDDEVSLVTPNGERAFDVLVVR